MKLCVVPRKATLEVRRVQVRDLRTMRAEARKRVKERVICTLLRCAELTLSIAILSACTPGSILRLPPIMVK
jgi:hypothetical protein